MPRPSRTDLPIARAFAPFGLEGFAVAGVDEGSRGGHTKVRVEDDLIRVASPQSTSSRSPSARSIVPLPGRRTPGRRRSFRLSCRRLSESLPARQSVLSAFLVSAMSSRLLMLSNAFARAAPDPSAMSSAATSRIKVARSSCFLRFSASSGSSPGHGRRSQSRGQPQEQRQHHSKVVAFLIIFLLLARNIRLRRR